MRRRRLGHAVVPLLTAIGFTLALAGASPATASLPTGLGDVVVNADAQTSGISAFLHPAGAISGTITLAGSGTPVSVTVSVFKNGNQVRSTTANGSGNYTVGGLRTGNYVVCAQRQSDTGTGTLPRCYPDAAWSGGPLPSSATSVPVTTGSVTHNKDISVHAGGAIAGTVRDSSSNPIASASVLALDRENNAVWTGYTDFDGTYQIRALRKTTKGYTVCFRPPATVSGTGHLPRCYRGVAWDGRNFPSNADRVDVTLGTPTPNIDAKLPTAGAISGTVSDTSSNAVKYDYVTAFTTQGHYLGSGTTDGNGSYWIGNLPAATADIVCAAPANFGNTHYDGECWHNVAWDGKRPLPNRADGVSVSLGDTHQNINFTLATHSRHLASISGLITDAGTGLPVANVGLAAYDGHGHVMANGQSDSNGAYTISLLRPSATGYYVCAYQTYNGATTGAAPTYGWAPRCFKDVAYLGLKPPSTAKLVPLSADQVKTGVGIALHPGGEIDGTISSYGAGSAPLFGYADVFSSSGRLVRSTADDYTTGVYTVGSLSPATYHVCFLPYIPQNQQGYLPQCYDGRPWNGLS